MNLTDFKLEPHQSKTVTPGDVFGRLVVLATGKVADTYKYKAVVRCACGTVFVARLAILQGMGDAGCTCAHDRTKKAVKHGLHSNPLYRIWWHMVRHCNNPKSDRYHDYGGLGIAVCERWQDVTLFHEDMQAGYADGLTIDRIDNEKGYSPENCRWATKHTQMRNRRSNINVTIGGKTQILKDWCVEFGINYHSVYHRITSMGWEPGQALHTPFLTKGQPRVLVRP